VERHEDQNGPTGTLVTRTTMLNAGFDTRVGHEFHFET
jgi:hypothetical protein